MKTITHNCPKCNAEFNAWSKWGIKKFCSRSCANGHTWSTEQKLNQSKIMLKSPKAIKVREQQKIELQQINKTCPICSKYFKVSPSASSKIYCSRICYINDDTSKYRTKSPGGYRVGSGRSNSGYYKGIYCGSTYELCWVIHSLDHDIAFMRFDGLLERDGLKYYPDFLLADGKTIIETKGFEKQESVDRKTVLAESFGYTVKVLRKDDLQYAFDYVKEKYSTTEYKTLYDGYKPKYSYVCNHCSAEFSRDKKLKTDVVFCSRTCCGKGHKGVGNLIGKNQYSAPII